MHRVIKFLAYIYCKIVLLIGYDWLFDKQHMFGLPDSLYTMQTQKVLYFLVMALVIPLIDTITLALPIYLSLRYKGSMKWIMLLLTFVIEFIVSYYALFDKVLTAKLFLKLVFSIISFVLIYRRSLVQ